MHRYDVHYAAPFYGCGRQCRSEPHSDKWLSQGRDQPGSWGPGLWSDQAGSLQVQRMAQIGNGANKRDALVLMIRVLRFAAHVLI
jgi:hypothetical protein